MREQEGQAVGGMELQNNERDNLIEGDIIRLERNLLLRKCEIFVDSQNGN